ncbi:selenocysteine-specific translation elongation factor [bacterium]|nr:selenocysteine-specific translation elongation factor [bacterium]
MTPILIGTAGHIDHGKTRLVGRLTGVDTDRLPEEKARGISIDLGFAHFDAGGFRFGVVDVPGHEKFVRNMVAGATGINLALLVVAADDGVMPQTREHLEIMDLLGIRSGLVALTKTDLVDPEMVALAQLDIEDCVSGTFLEGCRIVPVSSETGSGIDELRTAIAELCTQIELPQTLPVFRMAIDRVFSITGHGTVVTGSVLSGEVHVGGTLELWPSGREVRIRSVQHHGEKSEEAGSRQRTAINLAGLKQDEVSRGCELATPGYLKPTSRLLVDLRVLSSSPLVLKDRIEVSLHLGTREVSARIILKGRRLEAGQRGIAELRLAEPVVAAWGQHFILRRTSPAVTIGGGRVLDPAIPDTLRVRDIVALGTALQSDSPAERLAVRLTQRDSIDGSDLSLASSIGVMPDELQRLLSDLRSSGKIVAVGSGERRFEIHQCRLAALAKSVLRTIRNEVLRHQPRRSLPKPTLLTACREIAASGLLEGVIEHLVTDRQLVRIGENLGPADLQVQLTKAQRKARDAMLDRIAVGQLAPPLSKELAADAGLKVGDAEQLLNLAVEDGLLLRVADGLYLTPQALEAARLKTKDAISEFGPVTMAQLRDAWGVTRKHAVPLCEYFDEIGVTRRDGDTRSAGPAIDRALTASEIAAMAD